MATSIPKRPSRIFAVWLLACLPATAQPQAVRMEALDTVYLEPDAKSHVARAARVLQTRLTTLYGREWAVAELSPPATGGGVLLGRSLAVASDMIAEKELESVKMDGYVIRASGSRIALAGYDDVGTTYAVYELLRQLGLKSYPWRGGLDGSTIWVDPPEPIAQLGPLSVVSRPYFEHRDLLTSVNPQVCGTTIRELRLADPKDGPDLELFGRDRTDGYTKYTFKRTDYVDWFHTAPYLVPRDRYHESHPEYFAMAKGKRIEPAPYARTQICTSNPDVVQISTERALAWVEHQRDRHAFCITPGDTALCDCPACQRLDPMPGQAADRIIQWVNSIARAVAERYPDKLIITGAYHEYTNPPLTVAPEPNVRVWYAPWYWNSRADSYVSFDHPINVIAMKELMSWSMRCPSGQVGLYDYPGNKALGAAERIKMYARHGFRTAYFNGAKGDHLLWLGSRLLWDPFQDVEPLNEEFLRAYYGPAAEVIADLLRLKRAAIERYGVYGRSILQTSADQAEPAVGLEYFRRLRELLERAEGISAEADGATRVRIVTALLEAMTPLLASTHPRAAKAELRSSPEQYERDLDWFRRLSRLGLEECDRLELKQPQRDIQAIVDALLIAVGQKKKDRSKADVAQATKLLFDPNVDDEILRTAPGAAVDTSRPKAVSVPLDQSQEAERWLCDGTQAQLVAPARMARVHTASGPMRGVQIVAPLTKLPEVPWENIRVHAGRFYAERTFPEPLDVEGCLFLDLHLRASCDVPVTVYADKLRADFQLHAGEQIVRIDMRSYQRAGIDVAQWKQLSRVALDVYPQDLFYPHPTAQDAVLTLLGLEVSNQPPTPDRLPHRGKAIWLTQFRPNVPNDPRVPSEYAGLFARVGTKKAAKRAATEGEPFRTFTQHRAVSPMSAILTGRNVDLRPVAEVLQHYLERIFGVRLPIDPANLSPGPDVGNVILLGRDACLAARHVTEQELSYVGPGGFAINAWQGRVALAGADAGGDAAAVERYIEDHFARLFAPGVENFTDLRTEWLHELYTLDKAWFADRPPWERWWLAEEASAEPPPTDDDTAAALELAHAIKELARANQRQIPDELLERAEASALSRCVVGRLARNPFLDATRIIRNYCDAAETRR